MRQLRSFPQLFTSDMRYGFSTVTSRLMAVTVVSCVVFFLTYSIVIINMPEFTGPLTLGECFLCMWTGRLPYDSASEGAFQFPLAWLTLLVLMGYVVADYPTRDLSGIGSHFIVKTQSRWAWWLSKCAWVVVCAFVCWAITIAVCFIAALLTGATWDTLVRPGIAVVLEAGKNEATNAVTVTGLLMDKGVWLSTTEATLDPIPALLGMSLSLAAIMLVQLAISVTLHPIVGLAVYTAIVFFSSYFTTWLLPGTYLMIAKSEAFLTGGMDPLVGAALALTVAALAILFGGLVLNRKDLLGKEGDAS